MFNVFLFRTVVRADGNLGGSDAVVRFKGMAEYPDKIPACAGMTALVIFRLP